MLSLSGILGRVAKGLSRNSEALLVFGLALISIVLVQMGVNSWLACGMPSLLYILYMARQERSERHIRDMAQLDLERLEASRSATLAKAYAKTLNAPVKAKAAPATPKIKKKG